MKKILIPFEGASFPQEQLDFARELDALSPILLTAAFVPEVDYAQLWNASGGVAAAVYVPEAPDLDIVIERNSGRVRDFCARHNIRVSIHSDRMDFALPAIRKEARFADLLAVSATHFFDVISARQPNAYMKEILHQAECSIILLPENPMMPSEVVLTYDGTGSSVYAIKQFAYLFPELATVRTSLVHLRERKDDDLPDRQLIEEIAFEHFKNLRVLDLAIRPEDFFDTWIAAQQQPWLVAGSYGRSDLSRMMSGSFISQMIRAHKVPLFIAHQ